MRSVTDFCFLQFRRIANILIYKWLICMVKCSSNRTRVYGIIVFKKFYNKAKLIISTENVFSYFSHSRSVFFLFISFFFVVIGIACISMVTYCCTTAAIEVFYLIEHKREHITDSSHTNSKYIEIGTEHIIIFFYWCLHLSWFVSIHCDPSYLFASVFKLEYNYIDERFWFVQKWSYLIQYIRSVFSIWLLFVCCRWYNWSLWFSKQCYRSSLIQKWHKNCLAHISMSSHATCTYNMHNIPVILHNVCYIKIFSNENGSCNTCTEILETYCLFNIENEKKKIQMEYNQCWK